MTKKHYHHHIGADTGEPGSDPIIIGIGEPYPEEVDPALHEFNRITKRVAKASSFYRRWQRYVDNNSATEGELRARSAAKRAWESAVDEYEKVCGE